MITVYTQVFNKTFPLFFKKKIDFDFSTRSVSSLNLFWYKNPCIYFIQSGTIFPHTASTLFYVKKAQLSLKLRSLQLTRTNYNPIYSHILFRFLANTSKKNLLQLWFILHNSRLTYFRHVNPRLHISEQKHAQPMISNFKHL